MQLLGAKRNVGRLWEMFEYLYEPIPDEEALGILESAVKEGAGSRTDLTDKWIECDEAEHLISNRDVIAGRANIYKPDVFWVLRNLLPRMVGVIHGYDPTGPVFDFSPVGGSDDEQAFSGEQYLNFKLRQNGGFSKHRAVCLPLCKYGWAMMKVGWWEDWQRMPKTQTIYDDVLGLPMAQSGGRGKRRKYIGPDLVPRSVYDVYLAPGPDTIDVESAYYTVEHFHERTKQLEDNIETLVKPYKPEATKKLLEQEPQSGSEYDYSSRRSPQTQLRYEPGQHGRKPPYELWEYHDNDGRFIVASLEHRIVLRATKVNPWVHGKKPYVGYSCVQEESSPYGLGFIRPILGLQYEHNDVANLTLDNFFLIVNKMWYILKDSNLNKNQLVSRPGGYIEVDNFDQKPEPVEFQDIKASSFLLDQGLRRDIEETAGATNIFASSNPEKKMTAFETDKRFGAAEARMQLEYLGLMDSIRQEGEMMWSLMGQFWEFLQEEAFQVTEKTGTRRKIYPDEIFGEYDIQISGGYAQQRQALMRSQLVDFIGVVSNPVFQGVNYQELGRSLAQSFPEIIRDVEKIFPSEDIITIPILKENYLLTQNVPVPVAQQENDEQHLKIHQQAGAMTPAMEQHIAQHMQALQFKQAGGSSKAGAPLENNRSVTQSNAGLLAGQTGRE